MSDPERPRKSKATKLYDLDADLQSIRKSVMVWRHVCNQYELARQSLPDIPPQVLQDLVYNKHEVTPQFMQTVDAYYEEYLFDLLLWKKSNN
jgi:hypothetical protein